MTTSSLHSSPQQCHGRVLATPSPRPAQDPGLALLAAARRMHDSSDPQDLLVTVAAEALGLVAADGVVVLLGDRRGAWRPVALAVAGEATAVVPADVRTRCTTLAAARLLHPGWTPDLAASAGSLPARSGGAVWRSLLVTELDGAGHRQDLRLLWHAGGPQGLAAARELAELFSWHAALAVRTVTERHHLQQAVAARTVIGQATGIVMSHERLTADQAFERIRRYSQDHNVKLATVAETVAEIGQLPS